MKNILVPIGTLPKAHETLQYAVDFAGHFNAKVFVMEAVGTKALSGNLGKVTQKVAQNREGYLKEVIGEVDSKNTEIKIATFEGDIVDGINEVHKELEIDLVILAPCSNDINEELYLGNTTGRIVKGTNLPTLIVPRGEVFKPYKRILTAFSSGILKRKKIIRPLQEIQNSFESEISLLLVKTPGYQSEDLVINEHLMDASTKVNITEQTSTYLGVLEYWQTQKPDLLCVFRRKRGFFQRLWEKNTIPKSEFNSIIPVLVLSVKKY